VSNTIIRVENLSKKYIIGHQQEGRYRYKALRDVIAEGVKSMSAKVLNPNQGSLSRPTREEFWALKDVSFEVKQGDRVGIIGRNGAGKSTLLKILSRITEPTSGRIKIQGRVASLLEVGTGFHPELTGRENIYLNGAILGMSKVEIKRKFDEIVDFAEVEKFLDTPVKRYSSGMYVRLAFAVAAHLEPEILVVDEVLAVGDATFQKKCLGKMSDVSVKEGRTVLFVSHNMTALKSLCDRSVLLNSGGVVCDGETDRVISEYLEFAHIVLERKWDTPETAPGNDKVRLHYIRISPQNDDPDCEMTVQTPMAIECEYWNYINGASSNFSLHVFTVEGVCVFNSVSTPVRCLTGLVRGVCFIPGNFLNDGSYQITMMIVQDTSIPLYCFENVATFTINDVEREGNWYGKWSGVVRPKLDWQVTSLAENPFETFKNIDDACYR
jgi:lipopolysaccharide transport system ATP-binding protein